MVDESNSPSSSIKVKLTPETVQVDPGGSVDIAVEVQNGSNVVDVFTVDVDGFDASWRGVSVSSVSLFPGDRATSTLTISPPKVPESAAKTYAFTVKVTSGKDPSKETTVSGTLDVKPFYSFDTELRPRKMSGAAGSYTLTLKNTGNAELRFDLEGEDPEGLCRIAFDPHHPRVANGDTADVAVTVEPGQRPLQGRPRPYSFTLTATPELGPEPETVSGELDATARVPKWVVPTAIVVVAALAVVVALVVIFGGGDSGPSVLTVAAPLSGGFSLSPDEARTFEFIVNEPGFVLVQLEWTVTGNGLRVRLDVANPDAARSRQLSEAGLPLRLLDEDVTRPQGKFSLFLGSDYSDLPITVLLRNETPSDTQGEFRVSFHREAPLVLPTAEPTSTPTPTSTPVPSTPTPEPPTPTPTPELAVLETTARADPESYKGKCPVAIVFNGTILTNGVAGTVSYQWARSDRAISPVQLLEFASGEKSKTVTTTWKLGVPATSNAGSQTLKVISPNESTSNEAKFEAICTEDRWAVKARVEPTTAGTVSLSPTPGADGRYADGTRVTVATDPNLFFVGGCSFSGWTGSVTSKDGKISFVVRGDMELIATYQCVFESFRTPVISLTPIIRLP